MNETIWLTAFIIQAGLHIIAAYFIKKQWIQYIDEREKQWQTERQQLLDRIQAPSFAEYKQAEVKVIKAEKMKPEDLVPSLKLPLE